MKKIFFGNTKKSATLAPWGVGGVIWRTIAFLLLLGLLVLILSLFRYTSPAEEEIANFERPGDIYEPSETGPIAEYPTPDWGAPIPGGEEYGLPAPGDNVIPPYNEEDLIENPSNPYERIIGDQLYVIFDGDDATKIITTFAERFYSFYPKPDNNIDYYNTDTKTAVLSVDPGKRDEICTTLNSKIPELDFYVVPVEVFGQAMTPSDPVFDYPTLSWYFDPIQAREAWDITQGSEDIIIGVVDSYFDLNHEELKGSRIIKPYSVPKRNADVAPPPGTPIDFAGHGTFVASVAAGTAGNKLGSSGIAPNCKLILVSQGKEMSTVTMLEGILYCIYNGATVINISCGAYFDESVHEAPIADQVEFSLKASKESEAMWEYVFRLAEERGVTIVWSAGNQDILASMDSSKRSDKTIRVSAVDRDLRKADFSNFGNLPKYGVESSTISAPGVDIFGALPGNTYDYWPGTSFSAPIVTGTVALMKSINPDITTEEIIEILQTTGKPVKDAPHIGNLVQIKDALKEVKRRMGAK